MRAFELFENKAIAASIKAYDDLSYMARHAIDQWETANWHKGILTKSFKENGPVAQEIEEVFAPVRALLPPTVKLYRGISKPDETSEEYNRAVDWKNAALQSWTDDRRVAEYFAGRRSHQNGANKWDYSEFIKSDEEIEKALKQYEKVGATKFGNVTFIRNKENPRYYDMYRGKEYVTDGDDLRKELHDTNNYYRDLHNKRADVGIVLERMVPREDIIWISNLIKSKEYIVRVRDI